MYTFPYLLKEIRRTADLTQEEFASVLGVSALLISLIENGKREPSKKFMIELAEKMDVHPLSLFPFAAYEDVQVTLYSPLEKSIIAVGEKLQIQLVQRNAKNLSKYLHE